MKANEAIIPFFNKTPELVAGLNQLGMRNQAEVLFTSLLPGLNNVSNRVRYYSFYCWLIREFYREREQVVESEFNQFIRRAEYLLALVHTKGEGVQGIRWTKVYITLPVRLTVHIGKTQAEFLDSTTHLH